MAEQTPQKEEQELRWTERFRRVLVDSATDIKEAVTQTLDRAGLLSAEQMTERSRERAAQAQYQLSEVQAERMKREVEWHVSHGNGSSTNLETHLEKNGTYSVRSISENIVGRGDHSQTHTDRKTIGSGFASWEDAAQYADKIHTEHQPAKREAKPNWYENDPDPNLRGADRSKRFHNENLTRIAEGAYKVGKEGIIQHLNGELLDLIETTRRDITKADIKELALDSCRMMANIKSNQWLAHQSLPIDIPRNIAAGPFEDDVKLGMRRGIFEWSHQHNQELKHAQENSKGQSREKGRDIPTLTQQYQERELTIAGLQQKQTETLQAIINQARAQGSELQWSDLHQPDKQQENTQAVFKRAGYSMEVA